MNDFALIRPYTALFVPEVSNQDYQHSLTDGLCYLTRLLNRLTKIFIRAWQ